MLALVICLQDTEPLTRCCVANLLHNYSYSPFGDPVQGQGRVDAMAFASISNATNNPDQGVRKAAEFALGGGVTNIAISNQI
jgi:hypothetical protein